MLTLAEMQKKRDELALEADAIIKASDGKDENGESRTFTDDDEKRVDVICEEVKKLDADIDRRGKVEALQVQTRKVKPSQPINPMGDDAPETRDTKTPLEFAVPIVAKSQCYKSNRDAYVVGRFLIDTLLKKREHFDFTESKRALGAMGIELRVATEAVNTAGGYLVPDVLATAIIEQRLMYGVARQEAEVAQMGSDNLSLPRMTGEITAYFVDETDSITPSQQTFDQVVLAPKKLASLTYMSSDVLEDAAISIADALTRSIGQQFAKKEDQCMFMGTGTSAFGGMRGAAKKILDSAHSASVFQVGSNDDTLGELVLGDFESAASLLPDFARATAKWYCHPTVFFNAMMRLADAAGGNTIETLQNGSIGNRFLGLPVVFVNVMSGGSASADLTDLVVALVGDLRQSAIFGDRRGITIDTDTSLRFAQDQTAIRGIERFDINVHGLGDTSDAGSLCALQMNT